MVKVVGSVVVVGMVVGILISETIKKVDKDNGELNLRTSS